MRHRKAEARQARIDDKYSTFSDRCAQVTKRVYTDLFAPVTIALSTHLQQVVTDFHLNPESLVDHNDNNSANYVSRLAFVVISNLGKWDDLLSIRTQRIMAEWIGQPDLLDWELIRKDIEEFEAMTKKAKEEVHKLLDTIPEPDPSILVYHHPPLRFLFPHTKQFIRPPRRELAPCPVGPNLLRVCQLALTMGFTC
jgi:hypothetical protein